MEQFVKIVRDQTIKNLALLSAKNRIKFNVGTASTLMVEQAPDRMLAIYKSIREEAKSADVLEGIKSGRLDPLTRQVASVALEHECLRWAQEILEEITGVKLKYVPR